MAAFDREDVYANLRQGRSHPIYARRDNTPTWIAGIIALATIIGVFTYESGYWGTHPNVMTTPTSEVTAPSG
jgi:hypothetical protein